MRGTRSKEAFELFKRGVQARALPLTLARWQESHKWFQKAIERDTGLTFEEASKAEKGYPRAWSWMAYGVALSYFEGWQDKSVIKEQAIKYADLSVKLGEFDYENHWVAAFVHLVDGNVKCAEHHMDEALYLNEEDLNMGLLNEMADVLVWLGRTDEAIKLLEKARRTSDWNRWSMAWSFYFKGMKDRAYYDRALAELGKTYWKPGQEPYEQDMQLLVAAIHAQKAALYDADGFSGQAEAERSQAEAALKLFRYHKPDWTIADELRKMPFAPVQSAQMSANHWVDGLKKLGMS